MTNPFAPLSSGGAWIKPADHAGHLVIVANVRPLGRKYDEMRKADVDVATFDFADVDQPGAGWQTNVQNSHAGFVNKLQGIVGNPEGKVLARVGQVQATNGHLAWVLADATAEDVPRAIAFLATHPLALPAPSPFANAAPAPYQAPAAAPVVAAAAPAAAAAPTQSQADVAALLAQLQAAQG